MAWMSADHYAKIRDAVAADPEWAPQITWSEQVRRPRTAIAMASEITFVICNSGMHHKAARSMFERVSGAIDADARANRPIALTRTDMGHDGKREAVQYIWNHRTALFSDLQKIADADLPDWLEKLPWIGPITKYHAAKNLGADVAKPDRWLDRIAVLTGETVDGLCRRLADASGDRVATVDLVLWCACATGKLELQKAAQ